MIINKYNISDTDSIGLGLTKSAKFDATSRKEMMEALFHPIVKTGKLEEFKSKVGEFLVLSNEIEDEKFPGKLKEEFQTTRGEMISLCPKTYYAHCLESKSTKDGRKGIQNSVELEAAEFKDVLYGTIENHRTTLNSLRLNKEKKMTRTSTNKRGLSGIIYKTAVKEDRILCEPLRDAENKLL